MNARKMVMGAVASAAGVIGLSSMVYAVGGSHPVKHDRIEVTTSSTTPISTEAQPVTASTRLEARRTPSTDGSTSSIPASSTSVAASASTASAAHDANDDWGGATAGHGVDDPANHDANDGANHDADDDSGAATSAPRSSTSVATAATLDDHKGGTGRGGRVDSPSSTNPSATSSSKGQGGDDPSGHH